MLTSQPMLSEREWTLIMELLQAERDELPVERRHTDSRTYSAALGERLSMVDDLLRRLQAQGVAAS